MGANRTALVRLLYSAAVADALVETSVSSSDVPESATGKRKRPKGDVDIEEVWSESDDEAVPVGKRTDKTKWKAEVVFTDTSYHGKKSTLLLFINRKYISLFITAFSRLHAFVTDRLVESRRIQRGIEAVYTAILPKGAHPFVYLR